MPIGIGKTVIVASNKFTQSSYGVRVTTGAVTETLNFNVVANRDYFATGSQEITVGEEDYVGLFMNMLNTNTGGGIYSIPVGSNGYLVDDNGHFQVQCTLAFQILWDDVLTELDPELFGFIVGGGSQPTPANTSVLSPQTIKGWWVPDQFVHRRNWGEPEIVGAASRTIGDTIIGWRLDNNAVMRKQVWIFINQAFVKPRFAAANNDPYNNIEWLFLNRLGKFCRFKHFEHTDQRFMSTTSNPGNYIGRLLDNARPWKVEAEQRLTSYRVELRSMES